MMTRDNIINIAISFIENYFPECTAAGITGSILTKRRSEESDLDIIVISNSHYRPQIETYTNYNPEIHVVVLPETRLEKILDEDIKRREGISLHMLASCFVIKDTEGILKKIKKASSALFLEGPPRMNSKEINSLLIRVESLLKDIEGGLSFEQTIFVSSRILSLLLELNLGWHQKWLFKNKHAPEALMEVDNELMSNLKMALKSLYAFESDQLFIKIVRENLELFQISNKKGQNVNPIGEKEEGNHVIAIFGNENLVECYREIVFPILWTKCVDRFYLFRNYEAAYPGVVYFLIIKDFTFKMKELGAVLTKVNVTKKWRMDYPCNYVSSIYGIKGIDCVIEDLYCNLFKEVLNIIQGRIEWSQNDACELSFLFLIAYLRANGVERGGVARLCVYLYDWWQSKWEESRGIIGYERVISERSHIREYLNLDFEQKQNVLVDKYGGAFDTRKEQFEDEATLFWGNCMKFIEDFGTSWKNLKYKKIVTAHMNKYSPFHQELEEWLVHRQILEMMFDMLSLSPENKMRIVYFGKKLYTETLM
jgi:hypothetical protein